MNEKWLVERQNKFEGLTTDRKNQQIDEDHEEALILNKRLELFVSPENIVDGINLKDINDAYSEVEKVFKIRTPKNTVKEVSESVGRPFKTMYIDELYKGLRQDIEENDGETYAKRFTEFFKGIPVVDLGAGAGGGYNVASWLKASGYIGVEPHNWDNLINGLLTDDTEITELQAKDSNVRPIPYSVIAEDALTFLKRLPDKSVGILSFGTDHFIIKDPKYIRDVIGEIKRVLHPKSAMLASNSVFTPYRKDDFRLEEMSLGKNAGWLLTIVQSKDSEGNVSKKSD